MPRPKSGTPPWRAVAFKLPPDELAAMQRYSDLHGISISDLLREGLRLRMAPATAPGPAPADTRLVTLLRQATALVEARQGRSETNTTQEHNGNTTIGASQASGHTVIPEVRTVPLAPRPSFNPATRRWGTPCTIDPSHVDPQTGLTLRSIKGSWCVPCNMKKAQARREKLKQAKRASQHP